MRDMLVKVVDALNDLLPTSESEPEQNPELLTVTKKKKTTKKESESK